jgi:hypothetical protein
MLKLPQLESYIEETVNERIVTKVTESEQVIRVYQVIVHWSVIRFAIF